MQLAGLAWLGHPVATGMATTNKPKTASDTPTTSPEVEPPKRIPRPSLLAALDTFAALVTAYAEASDADLAADREAEAAVRAIVEKLDAFAEKRNAAGEPRVMLAIMDGLTDLYASVRAMAERQAKEPSSAHLRGEEEEKEEVKRQTEIRHMLLWEVIAPWLADFTEDELPHVDLSAEEIRKLQGPKLAAQSIVAFLFDKGRSAKTDHGRSHRGRMLRNWERDGVIPAGEDQRENPAPHIFGSTLSLEKTIAFAVEAVCGAAVSPQGLINEHRQATRQRREEIRAELVAELESKR